MVHGVRLCIRVVFACIGAIVQRLFLSFSRWGRGLALQGVSLAFAGVVHGVCPFVSSVFSGTAASGGEERKAEDGRRDERHDEHPSMVASDNPDEAEALHCTRRPAGPARGASSGPLAEQPERACHRYGRPQGLALEPSQVVVTSGATEAIAASLFAVVRAGDECWSSSPPRTPIAR